MVLRFYDRLREGISAKIGSSLHRRVGGAFLVNIAGIGFAFLLQVILARILGAKNYGQYVYILAWVNFLVFIAKLGLDSASLRFIPEYRTTQSWGLLRGYISWSNRQVIFFSTVVGTVAAILVTLFRYRMENGLAETVYIGCVLLPLNAYLLLQASYLQGYNRVVQSQATQVIVRPMLLAVCMIAVFLLHEGEIRSSVAMTMNMLTTIATLFITLGIVYRFTPREVSLEKAEYKPGTWYNVALPMLLVTSFNLIINQSDIIMVGAMVGTTDAGIYSVATRLSTFITFAIIIINAVVAPVIAELHSRESYRELQHLVTGVAWTSTVIAIPIFLVLILTGEWLLLFFGAEFESGYRTLILLGISKLVIASTGVVGYLLTMSGYQHKAAYILGASAVLNLILNGTLIPVWGLEGAAIASIIATMGWTITMTVIAVKQIGINPTVLAVNVIKHGFWVKR
jgi:O-antigen/teichoic acid export membrane protein